ncbi:MAG: hypothetical protein U9R19_05680 [Bacteroidota bacterium]|nr:hypothetical protein [Bacteroidota bacterium]
MNQRRVIYFFGLIFIVFISSCEEKNTPVETDKNSQLISFTGCKSTKNLYATDSVTANQSCIEFSYTDNTLLLTHINAGFNCCPGEITADFTFSGNAISISENESAADCDCDCLYDLEMQITSLSPGIYNFIFIEPYAMQPGQEIAFTLNLNDSVSGIYCVDRNHYPWGIF